MRIAFIVVGLGLLLAESPTAQAAEPFSLTGGRVEIIDRARLASDQNGILKLDVPLEGTRLTAGQLAAQLEDRIPLAALLSAEVLAATDVDVRAAQNEVDAALVELERAKLANSRSPTAVPELEVRKLDLAHKQAILKREQAVTEGNLRKRQRDEAAALVKSYEIRAPFAGAVTQVFRQRGEAVRQGDPILEMASLDRVRIVVDVPLAEATRFQEGLAVVVIPNPPGGAALAPDAPRLAGVVQFVSPEVIRVSGTVAVQVLVPRNDGRALIPGLTATIQIPEPRPAGAP